MKKIFIFLILILVVHSSTFSEIIQVPGQKPTIQGAIDISNPGDTILVNPGIYYEQLIFNGKPIVVGSMFLLTADTTDILTTIIDGGYAGSTVIFENNETPATRLSGFTIRNGNGTILGSSIFGGGIYCVNSSPLLDNLLIKNNTAPGMAGVGGGIFFRFSNAILKNSTIGANSAYYGGGIRIEYSDIIIENVMIRNNYAVGTGGGLMFYETPHSHVSGCVLIGNSAVYGGAISCVLSNPEFDRITCYQNSGLMGAGINVEASFPKLVNSIFWKNAMNPDVTNEIMLSNNDSYIMVAYCDIKGGQDSLIIEGNSAAYWEEGNINLDPEFEDPDAPDVHLQSGSPCIDNGTPLFVYNNDTLVKITDFSGSAPDMGAFEYNLPTGIIDNLSGQGQDELEIITNLSGPSPSICFRITNNSNIVLSVYDLLGKPVKILKKGYFIAGEYDVTLNANDYVPGLYIACLKSGNNSIAKKFLISSLR